MVASVTERHSVKDSHVTSLYLVLPELVSQHPLITAPRNSPLTYHP
jgi:hypothetical protein